MAFLCLLKVTGYLKTFIKIMVSLKFHCKINNSDFLELQVLSNDSLHISILEDNEGYEQNSNIVLDKSTAIKLSKELRKQIALLD
jgi:hypothetical protein